mgnify:CR=1 FL=1|jgi:hypothetical protein
MTVHHVLGARRLAAVLSLLALAACGGSSDEGEGKGRSTDTTVSTNAITFSVPAPDAETPPAQTFTATFDDAVAHLAVIHSGNGIASVSSVVNGRTAEITVQPAAPSEIGSGIFRGTIAVTGYFCANTACSSLVAGNTEQVVVTYQISPVILTISPYVGTAGVAGTALIRGVGFRSFPPQSVRLGEVSATEFTLISDEEIEVDYPALPVGRYPVQVEIPTHEGTLQSEAELVIVEPTSYAAATVAYPTSGGNVREVIYDSERRAVFVATDQGGGSLVRFAYGESGWDTPTQAAVADLQDIALSTRGEHLLAVTKSALLQIDPQTLAVRKSIDPPELESTDYLRTIGVMSDDRALITTGRDKSEISPLYLYTGRRDSLTKLNTALNNATAAATLRGSSIVFIQGITDTQTPPAIVTFTTLTGSFDGVPVYLLQNSIAPAIDLVGTRAVLNGTNVYGGGFALLGKLPATTVAVALKPDGSRAYTYDPTAGGILTFDVSKNNEGKDYEALGAAVPLAGNPGTNARMTISLDGKTLFIAGPTQLVVQPTPAL